MCKVSSGGPGAGLSGMMAFTEVATRKDASTMDYVKTALSQTRMGPILQLGSFVQAGAKFKQDPSLVNLGKVVHEAASFNPTYSFVSTGATVMKRSVDYCMEHPKEFSNHLKEQQQLAKLGAIDPFSGVGIGKL